MELCLTFKLRCIQRGAPLKLGESEPGTEGPQSSCCSSFIIVIFRGISTNNSLCCLFVPPLGVHVSLSYSLSPPINSYRLFVISFFRNCNSRNRTFILALLSTTLSVYFTHTHTLMASWVTFNSSPSRSRDMKPHARLFQFFVWTEFKKK